MRLFFATGVPNNVRVASRRARNVRHSERSEESRTTALPSGLEDLVGQIFLGLLPLGLLLLAACIPAWCAAPGELDILEDFVRRFPDAEVDNATEAAAGRRESSGGVVLPGIYLHPNNTGDASVRFKDTSITLSSRRRDARLFLLFRWGLRDGVPWGDETKRPNGVRFAVDLNDAEAMVEDVTGDGWRPRALELTEAAHASTGSNRGLQIRFRVNAIDGDSNHDWAVIGDPLLVSLAGPAEPQTLPADCTGVVLARLAVAQPSAVLLAAGNGHTEAQLPSGTHWVPVHFSAPGALTLEGGVAEIQEVLVARYAPQLAVERFALGSPLVTARAPFNVVLELRNIGRGHFAGGPTMTLLGAAGPVAAELPAIDAGAAGRTVWKSVRFPARGEYALEVDQGEQVLFPLLPLGLHAFPGRGPDESDRSARSDRSDNAGELPDPVYRVQLGEEAAGAQVEFVKDASREVYALARVWDGTAFQPAGSIYPLAESTLLVGGETRAARRVRARFLCAQIEKKDESVVLTGEVAGVPVRASFRVGGTGRFEMITELSPREEVEVIAFRGPRLLAGDRAYGAANQSAIFPILEGDETSSSERDLVYFPRENRVPAPHRIAMPLMAVQGNGTLMAMLWDVAQPWAGDARYPAAYFDAPGANSDYETSTMNLFAPSVGEYVEENHEEAARPYLLPAGETLTLRSWLVLDRAMNIAPDSLARGPHDSALAQQIYQHYVDAFGD